MSIATIIPAITAYTGTVPDKATMTKTVFANSINPYLNYVDDTFVPSYETAKTALNSAITEINEEIVIINAAALATAADVVLTHADVVLTHADVVLTHADVVATAAIYDSFDDRELGSKTSAPTLDNDGNALQEGAQYWNSVSKKKFIWNGSAWVDQTIIPTDHGSLTGLADDDHSQYHNDTRGDARYLKLAGGSLTGELLATAGATVTSMKEVSIAMGAVDINCAVGNVFTKTVVGATTLTVSNVPTTGDAYSFVLKLTNGGAGVVTWFAGVKWAGGTAPTLTAAGVDAIGFITHDGGTTWYGFKMGLDLK